MTNTRPPRATMRKHEDADERRGKGPDEDAIEHEISEQTAKQLEAIAKEAASSETTRSYAAAAKYIDAWYTLRFGKKAAYPFDVNEVLTFIADHIEAKVGAKLKTTMPEGLDEGLVARKVKAKLGTLSQSTVKHRLAYMSKVHRELVDYEDDQINPFDSRQVKTALKSTRLALAKRGGQVHPKSALTLDLLEEMLETCEGDGLRGLRDAALLCFAFSSGGRRRSEVAAATVEQLTSKRIREIGEDGRTRSVWAYSFRLGKSKTNQEGSMESSLPKPIQGRAAEALHAWLTAAKISKGALFRGIVGKGANAKASEEGLTGDSVRRIVIDRAKRAGLVGAESGAFSAHSLRSGFVTQAGKDEVPIFQAMAMTEHKSLEMFGRYFRAGELESSPAAKLMDRGRKKRARE